MNKPGSIYISPEHLQQVLNGQSNILIAYLDKDLCKIPQDNRPGGEILFEYRLSGNVTVYKRIYVRDESGEKQIIS